MLTLIIVITMFAVSFFFLYCLLSVKTDSERAIEDQEQAEYIRNYRSKQ